jgi:hypothetical protein
MNKIEKLLIEYSQIFSKKENQPKWAVKKKDNKEIVNPSIPFVGKNYGKTKILLYASAENLGDYDGGWLDDNELAKNRHRFWFDNYSDNRFFPDVHIAPINKGGLVNILGYVSMKLYPDFKFDTPKELLEGVAFANFGKFSISVKKEENNIDYAGDYQKLLESIEYIKTDLNILNPEILIIPESIYSHPRIGKLISTDFPEIKVIPIYQIHHFNINGKNRLKQYKKKAKSDLGILVDWQNKFGKGLKGKTNENFYSYYTFLDKQIEKIK